MNSEIHSIQKELGKRLRALRQERHWTQKEAAGRLGVGFQQLNKYECGLLFPPLDKLIALSKTYVTSLDKLVFGIDHETTGSFDRRLLERFHIIQDFKNEIKSEIMNVLDALILKERARSLATV